MRVDLNTYAAVNKEFVRSKYLEDPEQDLGMLISILATSTMVPCIVVAYWLGEFSNWNPDVVESIKRLTKFYGYTTIDNKPQGAPV
jgi:hypothetical protein